MSDDLQIIIPMTGNGSRFKAAGYKQLKPLIEVQSEPILQWVVRMFEGYEKRINFICRDEHLNDKSLSHDKLYRMAPGSEIVTVKKWEKRGPVYDIMQVKQSVDDYKPVLISYCDYFMLWDIKDFLERVLAGDYDGAIPCYTGFHPHLTKEKNLYASCEVDADDCLIEIREKYCGHSDKTRALHSPGLYYFKSGFLMKKYFQKLIDSDLSIKGEFYASLPYNYMVADGLKIWCPSNVQKFCQWGTPEDLEEQSYWVGTILNQRKNQR